MFTRAALNANILSLYIPILDVKVYGLSYCVLIRVDGLVSFFHKRIIIIKEIRILRGTFLLRLCHYAHVAHLFLY